MSPTCPKSLSTLEWTCPGTWLHCMRFASRIQTSCGRWAMAGERSRSETVQTQCRLPAWFNLRFFCAACAEKAAGHHRAPPAEAGSVCHVQQQQVVPHSSSMIPPSHQASRSGTQQRGSLASSLQHLSYHHPSPCPRPTLPPIPTHLPSCPVHHESYATAAAECNRCSTWTKIGSKKYTCSDWKLYAQHSLVPSNRSPSVTRVNFILP